MSSNHGNHVPHITPFPTYIKVFGTLIVLTVITVAVAQVNLGALNTLVAMAIATVKAFVVMWWFMHLNHETKLNRIAFFSAFLFAAIFFVLTGMDIFTRVNFSNMLGN